MPPDIAETLNNTALAKDAAPNRHPRSRRDRPGDTQSTDSQQLDNRCRAPAARRAAGPQGGPATPPSNRPADRTTANEHRTSTSSSTPTGCARSAACSASMATPTPRRSPRSACTPCSTAARRRRASSPSTASASRPSAASASSATTSPSEKVIDRLQGRSALGHVRYSTTGETILRNVQPLFAELAAGGFAVAHNGNLTNGLTLRRELIAQGAICQSTSDTEVILHLVARSQKTRIVERFIDALRPLEGAYALVGADQQEADRRARPHRHPPAGARRAQRRLHPVLGNLRARHHRRQVHPRDRERRSGGDLRRGHREPAAVPQAAGAALHLRIHLFLAARFACSAAARSTRCARRWAANSPREAPVDADVVVPVPDSGVPAAIGYAQETGIPFELGIIRNHYVGRTFIEPTQTHPRARRQAEAQRQPRRGAGQARGADRRFDRARHHLGEDRADDVRGRRQGSAHAHLEPADQAPGLLRHRHAGAEVAAGRHPYAGGDARSTSASTRWPSSRSTASTARSAIRAATMRARSSPTTASPATIPPTSPTSSARPRSSSCRCWRKQADFNDRRLEGRVALVTGASRGLGASAGARAREGRRAHHRHGAHRGRAHRTRRRDQGGGRLGHAGAGRHQGLSGHRPARRGDLRTLEEARHPRRQCRRAGQAHARRACRARRCGTR